jgi:hypothetical protein
MRDNTGMPELRALKITAGEPGAILIAAEERPADVLLLPHDLLYGPDFVAQLEGFTTEEFLLVLTTRGLSIGVTAPDEAQVKLYWPDRITPEMQMTWPQPTDYADAVIRAIQRSMMRPVTITPTKLQI